MPNLSKSNLTAFIQCQKRLWLDVHCHGDAEKAPDARRRMADGNRVGELARSVLSANPEGQFIDRESLGIEGAIEQTKLALKNRKPIYEAGFAVDGAYCFVDILLPIGTEDEPQWRMVEVKSSTKFKANHKDDIAIQSYIATASGLKISSLELAHVNSRWLYTGNGEYHGLFETVDLTSAVHAEPAEINNWITEAQNILNVAEPPSVLMGKQCDDPHPCGFKHICEKQITQAEFPVTWLAGRLHKDIETQKQFNPALDMRDVNDELLTQEQRRIKAVTISGEVYFDQSAAAAELEVHKFPLYFLDFETIQFVVPIWADTKPYQQMPFQFSLHKLDDLSTCVHDEFLDISGKDPSRGFAEKLISTCGTEGAIFVYNAGFESARLNELADRFHDISDNLRALNKRMVDLHPIAKKHFYHPNQRGSWSIKYLLPAACPEMAESYNSLDGVQNGIMAMEAYAQAIRLAEHDTEKVIIEKQLRRYCRLDTWAMVKLWSRFTGHTILYQDDQSGD